jgi:hypothetical protein
MSTQTPTKKPSGKEETHRELSVFPTNTHELKAVEAKAIRFTKGGMADTILSLLRKHGPSKGKRAELGKELNEKFPKSSPATLRTQTYRGILYLRIVGEMKAPPP